MLNTIFSSVFTETTAAFTFGQFLACTAVSLILGLLIAAVYRYKSECTKSFAVTLVLMPVCFGSLGSFGVNGFPSGPTGVVPGT